MSKQLRATAAVIMGHAVFGFSFLFSKLALEVAGYPSILVATRFLVAFLVLNLVVLAGRLIKRNGQPLVTFSLKNKPKKDVLLLALVQPILYFAVENYGIMYTSSAFAGIIISLIPLAGIVCDVVVMHAKIRRRQIICAVCSVIGVALTTIGARDMRPSFAGIVLLLIAVLAGALFYVYSAKSGTHYNALERTYVMFGCGSAFYLVVALVQSAALEWMPLQAAMTSPVFWTSVLYLAVVSSVIAFLLLNFGTMYVSVSNASLFANVTTIVSVIAGVLILHENFTWMQGLGAVVILVSVTAAQMKRGKP